MSGLGRRSAALGRPLEGWLVASKRLGPLPRIKRGALGRGCGREGRGALPLPRAVVISTRLRVLGREDEEACTPAALAEHVLEQLLARLRRLSAQAEAQGQAQG